MTPRQRLDAAIVHFEAASDDPGRLGLAFGEVLHARNDLLAEEGEDARSFARGDDLAGGPIDAADARTRARLLEACA
jgi:hypothetical protein